MPPADDELQREWRADVRRSLLSLEARLGRAERQLAELLKADQIAEAVADKMREKGSIRLTKLQVLVALLAVLPGYIVLVHTLVRHGGHL